MRRNTGTNPRGFLSASLAWVVAFGLLALLGPVSDARAQQTGAISGQVTDEQGNAISGAEVLIEAIRKGALTNASGNYVIADVPAGTHTVRARFIGYRPQTAQVSVSAGGEATQSFTLAVDPLGLEELVVTATNEPRVKLQSSTAITTMTRQDIEEAEPRSTADLLKEIPGFYVESSGGEVNNNLFARGLPADGSYRYVVFLENGMPAHDANDLFFLGADNFIRVDENIETVEAVRGGNSALFGSNAPGGVVNFIDKTGGPQMAGAMKVTTATGGLARYEANLNGPLADDWRFSVGGFYRYDDGIRDPGFPASRGGQLKANLTRLLDNGYFRVYAKYLNDKNVFYLPLPLQPGEVEGDVVKLNSDFVPGFPEDGTLTTNEGNQVRVPLPLGNGELTLPLDKGIAQTGGTLMADLRLDFGDGWTIQNTARAMNLNHENNALVPGQIVDASEFVADSLAVLDAVTPGHTAAITYTSDSAAFNTPNDLLHLGLIWHVEKPVTNFSNQFQVSKLLATGETQHNLTLGTYFGFYTADNRWFFNDILTDVRNQPRFVDVVFRDASGTIVSATENGFRRYVSLYVNGFGRATLFSVYGADEVQLTDRVRLDVGARFEHADYTQNAENSTTFDLENANTTADDAVGWGTRTFTRRTASFDEWAASIGVNYSLNDQVALYVRGSRGYKMPLIDQYLFEQFPDTAETLWQAEAGVKMSTPTLGLSAVGYFLTLENFPSQDARLDTLGNPVFVTALVGKARTIGAEVEAVVAPVPGLRLNGVGTFQFHEYTDFVQDGDTLDGNWVRRIPQMVLNLGGSYNVSGFTIGGEYSFYGKRFSNNANTIELPSFGYANARASYRFPGQNVTLSAAVLNAFDGQGLTEGNPRLDETTGLPAGPALARPILPRRFEAAIRYNF